MGSAIPGGPQCAISAFTSSIVASRVQCADFSCPRIHAVIRLPSCAMSFSFPSGRDLLAFPLPFPFIGQTIVQPARETEEPGSAAACRFGPARRAESALLRPGGVFIHLGRRPLPDLFPHLDRLGDFSRIRPGFESLVPVILQTGLAVGGNRSPHRNEFLRLVVDRHEQSPPVFNTTDGGGAEKDTGRSQRMAIFGSQPSSSRPSRYSVQ